MEAGSLPIVQEPLIPTKWAALAKEVVEQLEKISKLGLLAADDLDDAALNEFKQLSTSDALAVLTQFQESTNQEGSKSVVLCSLARARRASRGGRGGPRHEGGGGDAKVGPDEVKLKEILERTKYSHEVTTGQRKYGGPPPGWTDPQPGTGYEIYCGKLPKELYEDTLIPLFEKYGSLWDLRLMMDPVTGRNRGYCFVTYTDKAHAQAAITALNNYEVRPGRALRVNASVANVRLFVGNIPKNRGADEIKEEFSKHTEGLVDVIVYTTPDDERKKNRGFAFLDYDSHKSASAAKRTLAGGRVRVWGAEVFVEWAEPQDEPDEDTMNKVKVLYVRNLKADVTEALLKDTFEVYGAVERAKRVKGYGFVHFVERESALKAMDALNGTKLGDLEMAISLAKPSTKNKNKNDRRRLQAYNLHYGNGAYNDYWGGGYMGAYTGGHPMRSQKEFDYYGYDNYANGDFYGGAGGYDPSGASSYGYYGGYAANYTPGGAYASPRRGNFSQGGGRDNWYGGGSAAGGYYNPGGVKPYRGGGANRRGGMANARR